MKMKENEIKLKWQENEMKDGSQAIRERKSIT